ncbi:hypothetical protein M2132_002382 [Dysgonomonas sp. PH5-45]|uniref:DUF3298 and DUF4163 domain-containing protein n=1 Tax=unclassified Dysgonomonas TaxID=2630389 RepID=UPI002474BD64|nr:MULTISPECIES: DUF3298 and DUF4163 domain-containing protein [unclassified Dysgonomonas]MDH6356028.1 hypothetical protein [Dysgonomonas sp. PH5-45]MDH6388931.1 hypothetical protein [Dysgonomonas sp. PH5-37]
MKKMIYPLLLAFLVVACGNKSQNTDKENKTMAFALTDYHEVFKIGDNQETKADAVIPIAEGDSDAAKKINDKVFETIKLIVSLEEDSSTNYNELFLGFIKSYKEFVSETPDYTQAWTVDIKGEVEYNSLELINIKLESFMMTGGAHGNPYTASLIFDAKEGKALSVSDLVNDTTALNVLAEAKFREKYNIPTDKSLNSTGLMFVDDKFILPANIFVTKDGLLLFYNVYEIAPYVAGTKDILIPYTEIDKILSAKIKQ